MQMPDIDTDIPFAPYPPTYEDLQDMVSAVFRTLSDLVVEEDMQGIEVTDEDANKARNLFINPDQPKRVVDDALSSPGAVIHLTALLSQYDKEIVQSAAQLRRYITNRLLEDSNNPNPNIRIKCYELLGKISDVGLFTDKTEVTLRHRPTEELEQMLRERLMKTLDGESVLVEPGNPLVLTEQEPTPALPIQTQPIPDPLAFLDKKLKMRRPYVGG